MALRLLDHIGVSALIGELSFDAGEMRAELERALEYAVLLKAA